MVDTSIIVPARGEPFLQKTVDGIIEKATGDYEIIVVYDGNGSLVKEHPRVKSITNKKSRGLREATNQAARAAQGEYILRVDAHVLFDESFDEKLLADMKDNWVSVPRRYSLDPEGWRINPEKAKSPFDHFYIAYPTNPNDWGGVSLAGRLWKERTYANWDIMIDDLMMFQGSCWFMKKDYFFELGELDTKMYGPYGKGALEILLRCWLTGGEVKRNKNTWYAHLFKGKKHRRSWPVPKHMLTKGGLAINKWFIYKAAYPRQQRPLKWLIDKFNPPGWEECNWEDHAWIKSITT
jgi:glycosyltransferase involved in cell wall biosynthesis